MPIRRSPGPGPGNYDDRASGSSTPSAAHRLSRTLALVLVLLSAPSCDLLTLPGGTTLLFDEPGVRLSAAVLTSTPGVDELGAYYCPDLIGFGGELACGALLGPKPAKDSLQFQFRVDLDITNPNTFPLPTAELLLSLKLFPQAYEETLAAVCVGFCDEGATSCSAAPLSGQCQSTEPEILSVEDLAAAAFDYLLTVVIESGTGGVPPELAIQMIPAGETRTLSITLAIGVEAMLDLLAAVFADNWTDYVDGSQLTVNIPYTLDGTLWFVVENLGRVPVGFGPLEGVWHVN